MKARHRKPRRSRSTIPLLRHRRRHRHHGALIAARQSARRRSSRSPPGRAAHHPRAGAARGGARPRQDLDAERNAAAFSLAGRPGAGASAPQSQSRTFDIPPGSLDAVLKAFETVTGVAVTLAEDGIRTLPSPGVTGSLTVEQALAASSTGTQRRLPLHRSADGDGRDSRRRRRRPGQRRAAARRIGQVQLRRSPKRRRRSRSFPRTLLDEQGATTLTDALRNVPGITMQAGEGGGASNTSGDMFNMRGFSANNSLFVDGVRDDGLIARDVFNLEQIEVFSGPTGSDVGRTNAAGYINLTTKTPQPAKRAQAGIAQLRRRRQQVRATVDVNQPVPLRRAPARSSATPRSASTRCGRTAASPAATTPRARASRLRRRSPSASARRRAPASSARSCGRTTSPTTACPRRRSPIGPLTPTSVAGGARRSISRTTTAVPTTTTTRSSRTTSCSGSSTTSTPTVTLRNQTRYNTTTREAVITSIANAGGLQPGDQPRHAQPPGERAAQRHLLEPDQPRPPGLTTGRLRHDLSAGLEISSESQFAPTLAGVGTRAPDRPQPARRLQPGRRHEHRPDRRALRGQHRHGGALRLRRVRPRPARARQRRDPRRALRHDVARGHGRRRRDRHRGRRHARQRQGRPRLPAESSRATSTCRTDRR